MAFDAHTHLDTHADPLAAAARAREAGVQSWVIAGADPSRWAEVARVAEATGGVAILGLHPWWVGEDWRRWVEQLAVTPALRGVGETGLDRPRAVDERAWSAQIEACRAQLALARERSLPVVFHCVRAWAALRELIRADGLPAAGGMVHAWGGSAEEAREAVRLGLHLSFGTDLVRRPSGRLAEAARAVPGERLLVETDCPDRPVGGRAQGEPADLHVVAEVIAGVRGESAEVVLRRSKLALRGWWPN